MKAGERIGAHQNLQRRFVAGDIVGTQFAAEGGFAVFDLLFRFADLPVGELDLVLEDVDLVRQLFELIVVADDLVVERLDLGVERIRFFLHGVDLFLHRLQICLLILFLFGIFRELLLVGFDLAVKAINLLLKLRHRRGVRGRCAQHRRKQREEQQDAKQ